MFNFYYICATVWKRQNFQTIPKSIFIFYIWLGIAYKSTLPYSTPCAAAATTITVTVTTIVAATESLQFLDFLPFISDYYLFVLLAGGNEQWSTVVLGTQTFTALLPP